MNNVRWQRVFHAIVLSVMNVHMDILSQMENVNTSKKAKYQVRVQLQTVKDVHHPMEQKCVRDVLQDIKSKMEDVLQNKRKNPVQKTATLAQQWAHAHNAIKDSPSRRGRIVKWKSISNARDIADRVRMRISVRHAMGDSW